MFVYNCNTSVKWYDRIVIFSTPCSRYFQYHLWNIEKFILIYNNMWLWSPVDHMTCREWSHIQNPKFKSSNMSTGGHMADNVLNVFINNFGCKRVICVQFQIFKILHIMPKLKFINLSFNNLSSDINSEIKACEDVRETYPYLKSIVLNSTNITWRSFRHILKRMPMWVHYKTCSLDDYSHETTVKQDRRDTLEHEQLRCHRLGWRRRPLSSVSNFCKKITFYRYLQ